MKFKAFPFGLAIVLTSCGGASHPIVGNTFNLSSEAPTCTYDTGYDEASFFSLVSEIGGDITSLATLTNHYKSSIVTGGFLKVSDTKYGSGYLVYSTTDENVLSGIMTPTTDAGIDAVEMYFTSSDGTPITVASGMTGSLSSAQSYKFVTYNFKVDGERYLASVLGTYTPDTASPNTKVSALFEYVFTKK